MSLFWKRVIEWDPGLIGTMVYFSPNKKWNMKCVIRDDGTISPGSKPNLRFDKIGDLVTAWKSGLITDEDGKSLSAGCNTNGKKFPNDFFFNDGRRGLVKNIFSDACSNAKTPPIVNSVRELCRGFDGRRHTQAMTNRKWNNERKQFSPVNINGNRLQSKKCNGLLIGGSSICRPCQTARQRLYEAKRRLDRDGAERARILHTNNRWLTSDEKAKKNGYRGEDFEWKLRRAKREAFQLRMELGRYRPCDPTNRPAIQCAVKKMDLEQRKITSPICQWKINDDGEPCGFRANTIVALHRHVRADHYATQLEANKDKSIFDRRIYTCEWSGCTRRKPYPKFQHLRRHVIDHIGNAKTSVQLEMGREQMINWSRHAKGRRYRAKTLQVILSRWKSRRTHETVKALNPLPLPSVRIMLKNKNRGGIRPGIDWTVLAEMEKLGKAEPFLRHGFLSFDEIYINPKKQLAPNGRGEFGGAQNAPNELARTVLVFQFVALFSWKKFAINVAWFGCGTKTGLNADVLENWTWDVMLALQRHGFRVHALVSDGLSVNRTFYHRIALDSRASGFRVCADHVVSHPLSPDPRALLFLLPDQSHVMKRLRNCANNKEMGFGPSDVAPRFDDEDSYPFTIRWSDFEEVRAWQNQYPRVDRRLTKKHVDLNNYNKMNVRTAIDVMSEPIEAVMIEIDAFKTSGTRYYMRIARSFWRSTNDRRVYLNADEAKPLTDSLQSVADELSIWRENTEKTPERFLTDETYEDVLLLCKGIPELIDYVHDVLAEDLPGIGFQPRIISQDPLERSFGNLRQRTGGTQNLTVLNLAYNLRSINENVLNGFKLSLNVDS